MELDLSPVKLTRGILVITGKRGVGKTTHCQLKIDDYQSLGYKVAGLLSPGRFDNSKKTGIFVKDLQSGASRLLASSVSGEIDDIRLGL
jgi:nucleoside-triphosphatase THEP1